MNSCKALASGFATLLLAAALQAQGCLPQPTATFDGAVAGQSFGAAVAIDGDRMAIGSKPDSGNPAPGSVHIQERTAGVWIETFVWQPRELAANDGFGGSVSLDGDVLAAGAWNTPGHGAFYVLEHIGDTWVQTARITAPAGEENGSFGGAVAVSGGRILVTTIGNGHAHIYEKVAGTWTRTALLLSPVTFPAGGFGSSCALAGDLGVIGDWGDATHGANSGAAWCVEFDGSAWTVAPPIYPAQPQAQEYFGSSVATDGVHLVAGAPGAILGISQAGAAHVFVEVAGVWIEEARLQPQESFQDWNYGYAVAVQGSRLLVGEPQAIFGTHGRGYLYEEGAAGWTLRTRFESQAPGNAEGRAIALDGDTAALSAIEPNSLGQRVTLFDLSDCTWTDLGGWDPGANGPPHLYGYGPLAAGSSCELRLSQAIGFTPVTVFVALAPGSPHEFKGGTLLAFPPILSLSLSTPAGGQISLPFTSPAGASGLQLVAQLAVRDTAASKSVALSNALLMHFP